MACIQWHLFLFLCKLGFGNWDIPGNIAKRKRNPEKIPQQIRSRVKLIVWLKKTGEKNVNWLHPCRDFIQYFPGKEQRGQLHPASWIFPLT